MRISELLLQEDYDDHVEPVGYIECGIAGCLMDRLFENIRDKGFINATDWSSLKLYILDNLDLVDFYPSHWVHHRYNTDNIRSPESLILFLKKQLLDERFSIWLDRRIEEAKHATDFS